MGAAPVFRNAKETKDDLWLEQKAHVDNAHHCGELLLGGVEIYEYQPTMMHNKMLIVDGEMVSVGSTNFDVRSFRLNDEASLNVYDRSFAARMTAVFEQDLVPTKRYTYAIWQKRPFKEKFMEKIVLPMKSQL